MALLCVWCAGVDCDARCSYHAYLQKGKDDVDGGSEPKHVRGFRMQDKQSSFTGAEFKAAELESTDAQTSRKHK